MSRPPTGGARRARTLDRARLLTRTVSAFPVLVGGPTYRAGMQPRRSDHQGERGARGNDDVNGKHNHGVHDNHGVHGKQGGQGSHGEHGDELIIDCDRCSVRGEACRDCIVSVLLGPPPELDEPAPGAGRPRLRLVPVEPVGSVTAGEGNDSPDGRRAG